MIRTLCASALLFLSACCFVDHDQMAATAVVRYDALGELSELEDAELTPDLSRRLIQLERDAWEIQYARLTATPISSATRARASK